jgi:hypothetical protein
MGESLSGDATKWAHGNSVQAWMIKIVILDNSLYKKCAVVVGFRNFQKVKLL